jgi:HSP20 family molecular chaperone IbpA
MPRQRSAARKSESGRHSQTQRRSRKSNTSRRTAEDTSNVLPLRSESQSAQRESEQQEPSLLTWPLQMLDIMMRPWKSFMPFVPFADNWMQQAMNFPRVETRETDREYIYSVEMPGILPNQVSLQLRNGMLMLEVEDKQSEQSKGSRRSSRRSYHRTFSLPVYTDSENIKASLNDGMLTIAIPKSGQPALKQERPIGIR